MFTWQIVISIAIGLLVFVLIIRLSEINARIDALENVCMQSVTHDDMRAMKHASNSMNTSNSISTS